MEETEKQENPAPIILLPELEPQEQKPAPKPFVCVEITFRGNKKLYYKVARGANIRERDWVVANVEKGYDIGMATLTGDRAEIKHKDTGGHTIMRKANAEDLDRKSNLHEEENEAYRVGLEKIASHKLEMHLVEVEKPFDNSKITFYFLAEQRVDFRELVKDLAETFKMRIELSQIGVRDEAKRTDGISVCGLRLSCASFLTTFEQISTQMARIQHLTINQTKLSGLCGRLKCCLKYELDFYEEANKAMPEPGTLIQTAKGEAVVADVNVMRNTLKIRYKETGAEDFIGLDQVKSPVR